MSNVRQLVHRASLFAIIGSVVAGAAIYCIAVVWLGGILAAVAVPVGYFESFSRQQLGLALALQFLATWAIPVAAAVAAGVVAVLLLAKRFWRVAALSVLGGMVGAFLFWALQAPVVSSQDAWAPSWQAAVSLLAAPWYFWPNLAAPWAGFALGVWFVSRGRRWRVEAGVA